MKAFTIRENEAGQRLDKYLRKLLPDAPGSFIAWLCGITDVYAMEMPGSRYDIGNFESYEAVKKEYKGITKC